MWAAIKIMGDEDCLLTVPPDKGRKDKTVGGQRSPYFKGQKASRCGRRLRWLPTTGSKWTPPVSPFNLIQESLYHDPWKLLVATIFLNKTTGKVAIPILLEFLDKWPSPKDLLETAEADEIAEMLQPMGLNVTRANTLIRFSSECNIK